MSMQAAESAALLRQNGSSRLSARLHNAPEPCLAIPSLWHRAGSGQTPLWSERQGTRPRLFVDECRVYQNSLFCVEGKTHPRDRPRVLRKARLGAVLPSPSSLTSGARLSVVSSADWAPPSSTNTWTAQPGGVGGVSSSLLLAIQPALGSVRCRGSLLRRSSWYCAARPGGL